jgi:hypothetical protein
MDEDIWRGKRMGRERRKNRGRPSEKNTNVSNARVKAS